MDFAVWAIIVRLISDDNLHTQERTSDSIQNYVVLVTILTPKLVEKCSFRVVIKNLTIACRSFNQKQDNTRCCWGVLSIATKCHQHGIYPRAVGIPEGVTYFTSNRPFPKTMTPHTISFAQLLSN